MVLKGESEEAMTSFSEWLESRVGCKRIYLDTIAHLPEHDREFVIEWAMHTHIKEVPDPSLAFLVGNVDFGFKNLELEEAERAAIGKAFCGHGVRIPGTTYKVRYHGFMGFTLVEPAEGDEPELPAAWRRGLVVWNDKDVPTWIGKRAPLDRLGNIDFTLYRDAGDGWERL